MSNHPWPDTYDAYPSRVTCSTCGEPTFGMMHWCENGHQTVLPVKIVDLKDVMPIGPAEVQRRCELARAEGHAAGRIAALNEVTGEIVRTMDLRNKGDKPAKLMDFVQRKITEAQEPAHE